MEEKGDWASKNIGILNQQYKLLRLLGEGTTSRVYLSNRLKDDFPVAIKIFKSEFLTSFSEARQIFINELTALKKLDHPNIVKMYDYGIDGKIVGEHATLDGIWFLAIEYISERTLVDLIKMHGRLSEDVSKFFFA